MSRLVRIHCVPLIHRPQPCAPVARDQGLRGCGTTLFVRQ